MVEDWGEGYLHFYLYLYVFVMEYYLPQQLIPYQHPLIRWIRDMAPSPSW